MNRKLSPAWTLAILTGLNLFNYMDRAVLNAVRTPMAAEFGVNYEASGKAFTAFMIGYFITSPIFGYLGDRASRKMADCDGNFYMESRDGHDRFCGDIWIVAGVSGNGGSGGGELRDD